MHRQVPTGGLTHVMSVRVVVITEMMHREVHCAGQLSYGKSSIA